MLLIRNVNVFAPAALGMKDVLLCGGKIEAVADHIDVPEGLRKGTYE